MADLNIGSLFAEAASLTERLEQLHDSIMERVPDVDRVACALYDPQTDLLKTFVNSTRAGEAIARYEYELSKSRSLSALARDREVRVIDDLQATIQPGVTHSDYVLEQGWRSSFTVPMFSGDHLIGFMFFDGSRTGVFTPEAQRTLLLYVNLVTMSVVSELTAVRSLLATARAARDFVSLRDFETGMHLDRMARYSRRIAKGVAERYGLTDEQIEHIFLFAPLHDIGKIGVPDRVLLKPGRLDPEERAEMQRHIEKGVEIVNDVLRDYDLAHLADSALMLDIVAYHHEFLDGSGYPNGLRGDAIPVAARIVSVADIFDALTSARPYKEAWPIDDAIAELRRMAEAAKLDDSCVAVVEADREAFERIARELVDPDVPTPQP